jgi:mRNA guanylyltransferase
MKDSGEEFDMRIVEVTWDEERQAWRKLRYRDDKPHGNHKSIVDKILSSIQDGVELTDVLARQDQVRSSWKQREASRRGGPPQQQQQQRGPPPQRRPNAPAPALAPRPPAQGVMVGLKR